ncbi:MAG TPA: YfhO family protein [Acidimicrobiales bacterium]|nr:YfhO family protein [Acidimicrobiales bacterium]
MTKLDARPGLRELLWPAVSASLFATYVAVRYLPRSRLGYGFDKIAYTTPNQAVAFEALKRFRLPQWNPYVFGGAPHLANPQVGALYPLKYPFLWLPPHRAVLALTWVHLVLLALGMVALLAVSMKLRPEAVYVGSFAAVGSGVVVSQLPHFEQLLTIAWIPWLLFSIDVTLARRVRAGVGLTLIALTTALMLLCGHQQPAYYALLLASAWALGRFLDDRRIWPAAVIPAGIICGFGLAAMQLLPTAKLVSRSIRSGGLTLGSVDVPEFTLHGRDTFTALLGDPFSTTTPVGGEVYAAVGVACIFLAIVGVAASMLTPERRWHAPVVALAAAGGLLLAMGTGTPVYRVAFSRMPGLDLFRVPARSLVIFDIAVAVLAALGLDLVARKLSRRAVTGGASVVAGLGTIGLLVQMSLPAGRTVLAWALVGGVVVVAAVVHVFGVETSRWGARIVTAVALIEVVAGAFQPTPIGPVPTAEPTGTIARFLQRDGGRALLGGAEELGNQSYLRTSLRPNVNATERVRSLDGYDGGPWLTTRWTRAMEAFTKKPFVPELTVKSQLPGSVEPGLAARYGVRWYVLDVRLTDPVTSLPGWRGPVVVDGPLQLFENPQFRSEAIVYRRSAPLSAAQLDRQLAEDGVLSGTALVEGRGARRCDTDCVPRPVDLEHRAPERLVVDVVDAGPGVLVVAEGWDEGWSVQVDGQVRAVRPADFDLLAVEVREGDRQVQFSYHTPGLTAGAVITVSTMLVMLLAVALPVARRRQRTTLTLDAAIPTR